MTHSIACCLQIPDYRCHYMKMLLHRMLRVLIIVELSDQGTQVHVRGHSKVIFECILHILSLLIVFELLNKIVLHAAQPHVSSATCSLLPGMILLLLISSALSQSVLFLRYR